MATAAIKSNCIHEIITFIAPKILGGENSMNPLCDFEFREMHEIIKLSEVQCSLIGNDICVRVHLKINFNCKFWVKVPYGSYPKKLYRYGNSSFSL